MKQGKAPYVPPNTLDVAMLAQKGLHAPRDQAILMVSHYTGMRAMELASLTLGDVFDENSGQLREVVRLLARMTKGEKYREAFLVNGRMRETLRLYLTTRSLRAMEAPLFLSQRGGRFSANTMQRLLAICYRRAGIRASSHSGRRSFATHLIQAGADIYTVQQLLGHSSIATTQQYFTTSPERLRRAVGLLV
jgi:integrase/recombinase XerD